MTVSAFLLLLALGLVAPARAGADDRPIFDAHIHHSAPDCRC